MKLSYCDLNLSSDSDAKYWNDTQSINVETTDSNDGAAKGKLNLSMSIFVGRSRKKRKGKQDSGKGKKKKFEAREVYESIDNLASTSWEFASILRSRDKGVMSILECINNLLSMGLVQSGDELYLFALWFFHDKNNHIAYIAVETSELRFAWIGYCLKCKIETNQAKPPRAQRKL